MSYTAFTVKGWEYNMEFGVAASARGTYQVLLDKSTYTDVMLNMAGVIVDSNIPQYGQRLNAYQNLYCSGHSASLSEVTSDNWLYTVVCTFVPGHRLGNGYILTMRGGVSSVSTSRDWSGNLLTTGTYTDPDSIVQPAQGGEIQILYPTVDLTASGLSDSSDPLDTVAPWLGFVNSAAWQGYGAYQVLCTGVTYEPVSLERIPNLYRFEFQFQVQLPLPGTGLQGWDQEIFWRDANGRVPVDATIGNGIAHVSPYPSVDFNTLYPLGVGT